MTAERKIVSDTGPLITLEKLEDGYGFIRRLYDSILVPPSVLDELYQGQFLSADAYLAHYGVADLIEVVHVRIEGVVPGTEILDPGERDAIGLAWERGLPLLIEETAGRKLAQELGVHISGIAGQVVKAFRKGVLDSSGARSMLREMLHAGRINTRIYEGLTAAILGSEQGRF